MAEIFIINKCTDPTQHLTIEIPSILVERMECFAKKNGSIVAGVLIEVLDMVLRKTE
jgi:hypothetical protein